MTRRASDRVWNNRPADALHVDPTPEEVNCQLTAFVAEADKEPNPLKIEVDGDSIPMDIWFTVFINTTGDVLHHISAISKRFREMILQLKNEYDSPSGVMEALATRKALIFHHDLKLINYSMLALHFPEFNLIPVAKILVRSFDFTISQHILRIPVSSIPLL